MTTRTVKVAKFTPEVVKEEKKSNRLTYKFKLEEVVKWIDDTTVEVKFHKNFCSFKDCAAYLDATYYRVRKNFYDARCIDNKWLLSDIDVPYREIINAAGETVTKPIKLTKPPSPINPISPINAKPAEPIVKKDEKVEEV